MSAAFVAWTVSCSIKVALLLGASWVGARLLRRDTAAARHQVWTLGVVGALLLPVLCWLIPALSPSSAISTIASARSIEAAAVFVTGGHATDATPSWPAWFALAWVTGTLVVMVRVVRAQLAARRLVRTAQSSTAASWSMAMRDAATSLSLSKHVPLLRSESVGSPMTIGLLRPVVLLPAAAEMWAAGCLRAVLVHELAHVRRRDTLVQLAAQLACALYWWNPLAWLAAARLRVEREHASDDLVLGAGIQPSSYATNLLEVARTVSHDAHAGAICMVTPSETEARLLRILDATTRRGPMRARFRWGACGIALGGAAMLACTSAPPVLSESRAESARTTPRATVSAGTLERNPVTSRPPSFADLELSFVEAEVKRRMAGLQQCYERRLAARPRLAGEVVIHWTITETGYVPESCITRDTVEDRELTDCVNALAKAPFPAPPGGTVAVSFPFVFAPRG